MNNKIVIILLSISILGCGSSKLLIKKSKKILWQSVGIMIITDDEQHETYFVPMELDSLYSYVYQLEGSSMNAYDLTYEISEKQKAEYREHSEMAMDEFNRRSPGKETTLVFNSGKIYLLPVVIEFLTEEKQYLKKYPEIKGTTYPKQLILDGVRIDLKCTEMFEVYHIITCYRRDCRNYWKKNNQ